MEHGADDLSARNKRAWDDLYGRTPKLVWGDAPIGFIEEFVDVIRPRLDADSTILDAGTGEGRNLNVLLQLPGQVHACDASAHALEKIPAEIRDRVRTTQCDLSRLPYADDTFDFVLITDVIETLPDPDPVLRELARVMKPGGLLLCNIPGLEDEISTVEMTPISDNSYLFQDRYFYRFFTEDEATALLSRNGFAVVKNQVCSWVENEHPEFRGVRHVHTSRVFLAEAV